MFLHILFLLLRLTLSPLVTYQMSGHCLSLRSNVLSSSTDSTPGLLTVPFWASQFCFHPSVTSGIHFPLESWALTRDVAQW